MTSALPVSRQGFLQLDMAGHIFAVSGVHFPKNHGVVRAGKFRPLQHPRDVGQKSSGYFQLFSGLFSVHHIADASPVTSISSPISSASTTLPMLPRVLPALLRPLQRPPHCQCFPGYFQLFSGLFSVHHIANASRLLPFLLQPLQHP